MSAYRTHRHAHGAQTGTENGTDLAIRIAAFGAIRRAAEVAREYDRIYREAFGVCDYGTYAVTPDGDDVRRAIRAAIGTDKT